MEIKSQKLERYYVLLNRHFGRYFSAAASSINVRVGDIPYTYNISDTSFCDDKIETDVILFEKIETGVFADPQLACDELIKKMKLFLRNNLHDNNPDSKVLFWRAIPKIDSNIDFDRNLKTYRGYTRLAILNNKK